MKRMLKFLSASLVIVALTLSTSAAVTPPTTTFTLISGLPPVMHVGDSATVIVRIDSNEPFIFAMALPTDVYPEKGVGAHGNARSGAGTTAMLSITFTAKSSTTNLPEGVDSVSVVAGARYGNAGTISQSFDFNVQVP